MSRTRNRDRVARALEATDLAGMQRALGSRPGALRPTPRKQRFRPDVAASARLPAYRALLAVNPYVQWDACRSALLRTWWGRS